MNLIELLTVVLLLIIRFWSVLAEVSFLGIRRSKLEKEASLGDAKSKSLLTRLDQGLRLVPVIQLSGSIILLAIGLICARALFADNENSAAIVAERGVLAVMLLVLTLFFGDLIPRSVALKYPEFVGRHIGCLSVLAAMVVKPLLYPVFALTELLLSPLGVSAFDSYEVSEEDIKAMVAEGETLGSC